MFKACACSFLPTSPSSPLLYYRLWSKQKILNGKVNCAWTETTGKLVGFVKTPDQMEVVRDLMRKEKGKWCIPSDVWMYTERQLLRRARAPGLRRVSTSLSSTRILSPRAALSRSARSSSNRKDAKSLSTILQICLTTPLLMISMMEFSCVWKQRGSAMAREITRTVSLTTTTVLFCLTEKRRHLFLNFI